MSKSWIDPPAVIGRAGMRWTWRAYGQVDNPAFYAST